MSIDSSLKSSGNLSQHRNVLTRAERIERLAKRKMFGDDKSALGLPKVANRKVATGKKVKKKEGEDAAAPGTPAPAAAKPAGKK
jgi:small basic protein (TIGR04137 family)